MSDAGSVYILRLYAVSQCSDIILVYRNAACPQCFDAVGWAAEGHLAC